MKKCIWCSKEEGENDVSFRKLAHTIPQSLGGEKTCDNVCDTCNSFFGNHYQTLPPIETVIKETFNISRARLLASENRIGKNKDLSRFKSIYFKVDFQKNTMSLKSQYKLHQSFQEKICRQLKKGIYKIFLEETERQNGDGHDTKFDFIREFARYDLGDYPVFYFKRTHGIILISREHVKKPEVFMKEEVQMKYLVNEPSFFEFELLGHIFGIATSRHWELAKDNYYKRSFKAKEKFFSNAKAIQNFNDIDLTLSIIS